MGEEGEVGGMFDKKKWSCFVIYYAALILGIVFEFLDWIYLGPF